MPRFVLTLSLSLLSCGPAPSTLASGTYGFSRLLGREGAASATVSASSLTLDVTSREVKLTVGGATRRFTMSQASTSSPGCLGNFGGTAQETRALDAPNLQLGELLLDEPLLVSTCPAGSRSVVLQAGPVEPGGAAPGCSADVACVLYTRP